MHTTASDGRCRPDEVVARVHAAGLTTFAITDHDTVAALPEARALAGPRGLPADIVRKINAAARTALEDATVRQRIEESGAGVVGGTAEQYTADINAEYTQLKRVVQEQKLSLEAAN